MIGYGKILQRQSGPASTKYPTTFQYFDTPGETSPAFMFGFQTRETEV